jgi:adenosylhomocysteine nucleosidase
MNRIAFLLLLVFSSCSRNRTPEIVVLISANAEWKVVKSIFTKENYQQTPWGEFFQTEIEGSNRKTSVIFFHEGWGKTAAAGATQFAIDKWNPDYLINL